MIYIIRHFKFQHKDNWWIDWSHKKIIFLNVLASCVQGLGTQQKFHTEDHSFKKYLDQVSRLLR